MIPLGRRRAPPGHPGRARASTLIGALVFLLAPLLFVNLRGASLEVSAGGRQVEAQGLSRPRLHHQPNPANANARYPSALGQASSEPRRVQRVINDASEQLIQSEWHPDEMSAPIRRRRRRQRPHPLRPERSMRANHRVQQQQQQQPQELLIVVGERPRAGVLSISSSEPASIINLIRRRRRQAQAAGNSSAFATGRKQQSSNGGFSRRLQQLRQKYRTNQAISGTPYYVLLVIYTTLITFGTISNFLICLTVILKPKILSPRNIFIVNLAGSDLLLCVFTMPFSFIELSMKMWQLGKITCKLVASLQATSIFVSTISIAAIAIDRYKVIVYPTHKETASGARGAALLVGSVWIGALALSSPLFGYRTVERMNELIHDRPSERVGSGALSNSSAALADDYQNNNGSSSSSSQQLLGAPSNQEAVPELIEFCVERWPFAHGRGLYSVISMIFQYVLPITIVSVVYTQISRKLQKRLIRRQRLTQLECHQKRQLNLIRRTHTMLISVSLVFGLSWLPLNLLNVVSDFSPRLLQLLDDQSFRVIFAACHLIGCSSACSNPILYAFLNENFRKEFRQVYDQQARHVGHLLRRLCCCQPPDDATTRLDYELRRGSAAKQLEPAAAATCGDPLPDKKPRAVQRQGLLDRESASSDFSTSDTGNSSMSGSLDDDDDADDDQRSTGSSSSHAPLARNTSAVWNRNHSSLVNLNVTTAADGAGLEVCKSTRSLAVASGRHPSLLMPPDGLSSVQLNEAAAGSQPADISQSRKLSFQTVGKRLRFCLCLSDSSLGSDAPESANNKKNSIKMAKLAEVGGGDAPTSNEAEHQASERKRRRARRRDRLLRKRMLQLECECQCHGGQLGANEEVIQSPVRRVEMLEKQPSPEQMAGRRASRDQTRRENAAVGRRVWLRFLSGLSSQDDAMEAPNESCDNRLVKDKAGGQTAIELAAATRSTHEIDETARGEPGERATATGQKAAAKRVRCNNCKHSSGSKPRLACVERRTKRPRRDGRQQSAVEAQALDKVPARKSQTHDGGASAAIVERRKRRFQLPRWISFARSRGVERDSSKRLPATRSLAGRVNGLPSTGKQNSSTSSFGDSSKLGRALKQTSLNWNADELMRAASSRSPERSAQAPTGREQSVRKSDSGSSSSPRRLTAGSNIGQLERQQPKLRKVAIATASPANKDVSSVGGKQVGTVYLSIETGGRSRGDSLGSLSREKSTSVVVIGAEEEEEPACGLAPVAAASTRAWNHKSGCKLDCQAGERRRASHDQDDAQTNEETNNLPPLSGAARPPTQPGANQRPDNERRTPPASQSETRAAPRIQLCNADRQQPPTDIDAAASSSPLVGELQSSSASSSSYVLSTAASSAHSSSCTCSSASTASSCQWPASQQQQQQQHHEPHNRATTTCQAAANQEVAYQCPESRQHDSAAQTSRKANVVTTKRALQQHQSLTVVANITSLPASDCGGELSNIGAARSLHQSVRIGHQAARELQTIAYNSTGDPLDTTTAIGLRGQRTYSATTRSEALTSAQRVAVAASAAYRAAQRTINGAAAINSHCSGSLAALGLGASGAARPGLCGQNSSVANLNERSTATNTCGTTCGTATTASSCSLFTTTTTSRSSLSGELCGQGEGSIDFDDGQPSGGGANTASSERPNINQVCHQPTGGALSATANASKAAPKLEHTAPSLA